MAKSLHFIKTTLLILYMFSVSHADIYPVEPVWQNVVGATCPCGQSFEHDLDSFIQLATPLVTAVENYLEAHQGLPRSLEELDLNAPKIQVKNWILRRSGKGRGWLLWAPVASPPTGDSKDDFWTLCYSSTHLPHGFSGWRGSHLVQSSGHWGIYAPNH